MNYKKWAKVNLPSDIHVYTRPVFDHLHYVKIEGEYLVHFLLCDKMDQTGSGPLYAARNEAM